MASEAQWAQESEVPAERWASPERGNVVFRTLFGGRDIVPGGLTVGVGELEPGERLERHTHPPAEVYYVLSGRCSVAVGDEERELGPGGSVLIPGDLPHGVANVGPDHVRVFYVLAAESMAGVEYTFPGEAKER